MRPPWSDSWLPVPTSMPWTSVAVASELEEWTWILRKSVGVWPQNFIIFASVCLNFKLIEIVVGCGGKGKVKIVFA